VTEAGLLKRVEFWRRRLCPEWRVAIMPDPPSDAPDRPFVAVVEDDRRISEIRVHFANGALELSREDLDRVIVHELIHPLLNRVLAHAGALRPFVGEVTWTIYEEGRNDDEEELVNRLAHVIVEAYHGGVSYFTRNVGRDESPTPSTFARTA
jgi:hypothetical protein